MSDQSHDIEKHVKFYQKIYYALLVFTAVTVWISNMHFGVALAVTLALLVASTKGFLVASFFMHLSSERRGIYKILILTAVLFAFLISLPVFMNNDKIQPHNTAGKAMGYDYVP
jgi:cytochrome c oxidase subunit 4